VLTRLSESRANHISDARVAHRARFRFGEVFDLSKHTQGTEIKAITYSNMQIHHDKPRKDVYVIVDI
jgi:SHS2 domain-containing protein